MLKNHFHHRLFYFLLFLSFLYIFISSLFPQEGEEEKVNNDIRQAIRENSFAQAIQMCRERLRRDPENYDLNFLLGQAYAFSGKWDEALAVFGGLAARFPQNVDVLLMRARVESWRKNYQEAEKGYQRVLEIAPGNVEALTGLAELASWQGDFRRATGIYGQILAYQEGQAPAVRADILFRLGRVYWWSGDYERARDYFRQALRFDPGNKEYQRALRMANPRWKDKYEFRYEHQAESFNDGRASYVDHRFAFQVRLPELGPLVIKANMTRRFSRSDHQFEAEFYPRLWERAYAYLQASYSPKAVHFPEYGFLGELYQSIFNAWDVSVGYRRMGFAAQPVSIYLGSLGYYFGKSIAFFRWYYTPHSRGQDFSWTASLRRYFSDSNFLYVGYGQGSKPFELVTLEDYGVDSSWVIFGGLDWVLFDRLRLQLNYTHRDEGSIVRNLFFFSILIGVGPR